MLSVENDDGRVAQLDRVPGYEPGGRRFDSCRVRHFLSGIFVGTANIKAE